MATIGVRAFIVLTLAVLGVGCQQGTLASYYNPAVGEQVSPAPTMLTATVECLESYHVASGGQRVRRATGFGTLIAQRIDRRISRFGDGTPPVPKSLCRQLTSDNAASPNDWTEPEMPAVLKELLSMSGAGSVLVPVVQTKMRCDRKPNTWRWGEPAYYDEEGRVDCHEHEITLAAFIYDARGNVLWKAINRYELSEPLDATRAAADLLREAPIGETVRLRNDPS